MTKTLFVALLLLSAAPTAQAASHDRDIFIKEQDLHRDGDVTRAEFAVGREKEFARMDANQDLGITLAEYRTDFARRVDQVVAAYPSARRAEQKTKELAQVAVRFGVLDTDKSGRIDRKEFAASGWTMFEHHDTNKDRVVDKRDTIAQP